MKLPQITEYHGIRVLTTNQIAEMYGTDSKTISYNFSYNKKKYGEGKHYIKLEGAELKAFKTSREIPDCHKYSAHLYLWTEKGALLHAKSLNTDKAWEVYDYLVDFYFRAAEEKKVPPAESESKRKPPVMTVVDVPENPTILKAIKKIRDDLTCMDVLLESCIKYTDEEKFRERRKAASEVVPIIIEDWNRLLDLKPKLVEKFY